MTNEPTTTAPAPEVAGVPVPPPEAHATPAAPDAATPAPAEPPAVAALLPPTEEPRTEVPRAEEVRREELPELPPEPRAASEEPSAPAAEVAPVPENGFVSQSEAAPEEEAHALHAEEPAVPAPVHEDVVAEATQAETLASAPLAERPEPEPELIAEEEDGPPAAEMEEVAPAAETGPPPEPSKKKWYIVKVQSNREESIKAAIERRVKIEGLEEYFGQIIIPTERVTELRTKKETVTENGKKVTKEKTQRVIKHKKKFPGYLMAEVEFNDRILYLFRETSGVGDFVGAAQSRAPLPMPAREVERMLAEQERESSDEAKPDKVVIAFEKGDRVRVKDGIFADSEGEVLEIIEPKDPKGGGGAVKVKVQLTLFGRPTSVELDHWQVARV